MNAPAYAYGVQVVGNLVYVANAYAGLLVVDASDPSAASRLDACGTAGDASDVQVAGSLAYVADGSNGIEICQIGGSPVAGVSHVAGNTYRVDLGQTLPNGEYALQLGPEILDAGGSAMDQDQDGTPREASDDAYFARFYVDALPTVTGLAPANDATGVALGTDLSITFSENMPQGHGRRRPQEDERRLRRGND